MTGNSRFAVSVHMLSYLAYKAGAQTTSTEIASSVDTNPVVIRRLLATFVKARLVNTQKGAAGGFSLATAPENIRLLDIYRAVEPQTDLGLSRLEPNHKCAVGARIEDILKATFTKAQTAFEAELARVSVADIGAQLKGVCTGKH
ncbi:MAG: Rrf2 family transcriptional regulator [Nibricoccus sp.]